MSNETILVVDDNEANRDMLSRRLEKQGYRVITAEGGAEALDLIKEFRCDLALLRYAAEDRGDTQSRRVSQRLQRGGDLGGQLAGRCQHQARGP